MERYESSRELFESAREAARDARRCKAQLDELERHTLSIGSPSFDAHVHGGDRDHMARRVAAYIDRESELDRRIEDDYRLIDAATACLYGRDGMSDGLSTLAPSWWADAIWWHYLGLEQWSVVAKLMGCSSPQLRRNVRAAFEIMDANGMVGTVSGFGLAEG